MRQMTSSRPRLLVGIRRRAAATATAGLILTLVLSACTSSDGVAGSYTGGSNYTSPDGGTTVFAPSNRGKPIRFSAVTATGTTITSSDLGGRVTVVNFWYAQCAPCIREAPRLQDLFTQYQNQKVAFVGVNINDLAPQAIGFEKAHGVTYPTTIETGHNSPMRLAFSGKVSPTTTPTTIVLDKKGRAAARFSGEITNDQSSVVSELIQQLLAEKTS